METTVGGTVGRTVWGEGYTSEPSGRPNSSSSCGGSRGDGVGAWREEGKVGVREQTGSGEQTSSLWFWVGEGREGWGEHLDGRLERGLVEVLLEDGVGEHVNVHEAVVAQPLHELPECPVDKTCPLSTRGRTRRVQSVQGEGGGGGGGQRKGESKED